MKKLGAQIEFCHSPNIKVVGLVILSTFSFWSFIDSIHILILTDLSPQTKDSFLLSCQPNPGAPAGCEQSG